MTPLPLDEARARVMRPSTRPYYCATCQAELPPGLVGACFACRTGLGKLIAAGVREIRARLSRGETQTRIARAFGVDPSTVGDIAAGRTWSHVR